MLTVRFKPLSQRQRVLLELHAKSPLTSYVFDDAGLEDFKQGQPSEPYFVRKDRRSHQADLNLPGFGQYYLVVVNQNDQPVEFRYDIKAR